MAGVFELLRPQKRAVVHCNPKVLELQTAMEILAEVFGISILQVEEMLRERNGAGVQSCKEEVALWPESFCLVE